VVQEIFPQLIIDNKIIAVDLPPYAEFIQEQVQKLTHSFNQNQEIDLTSRYENNTIIVEGNVLKETHAKQITQAFSKIPGVLKVNTALQLGKVTLQPRIYFAFNSTEVKISKISSKIKIIKQFLEQNPEIYLRIVGHSDSVGQVNTKQKLALMRASFIQQLLVAEGVNPERLYLVSHLNLPPGVTDKQPSWLSRCVWFQAFLP
jgi:outer membrane protein OmpA-like peptidoglycan-associated protein